jgi:hypothetical protein
MNSRMPLERKLKDLQARMRIKEAEEKAREHAGQAQQNNTK